MAFFSSPSEVGDDVSHEDDDQENGQYPSHYYGHYQFLELDVVTYAELTYTNKLDRPVDKETINNYRFNISLCNTPVTTLYQCETTLFFLLMQNKRFFTDA